SETRATRQRSARDTRQCRSVRFAAVRHAAANLPNAGKGPACGAFPREGETSRLSLQVRHRAAGQPAVSERHADGVSCERRAVAEAVAPAEAVAGSVQALDGCPVVLAQDVLRLVGD